MVTTGQQPESVPRSRPNLKQEAAQFVRDLILSGSVHPGQRLDQDGIAGELGVSRLPVREALITLEAEGLVENIARRGSFVARLEPDDISDHYEMYGLLSGMAAGRAAEAGQDATLLPRLEEISAKMRSETDSREHDRLNFAFHQAINLAGSSRRLRAVLRILSNSMPTYFFAETSEWEWKAQALDEHDLIVAALRAGDGRSASQAMAHHFRHTGAQAVQRLKASGFWADPTPS
jgi:DNA-binding GntR family transcriptional regulator